MSDKVKEYPIIFSAPMVQAILDDKKHMTRRIVKLKEGETVDASTCWAVHPTKGGRLLRCPYGKKGERLWVRETWLFNWGHCCKACKDSALEKPENRTIESCLYRATSPDPELPRWSPAIFMPRWASRITLEIVGVKLERLQDITEEDAIAEGVTPPENLGAWERAHHWEAREAFRGLWESINGPESWERNDLVWAISFRRIQEGAK